MHRQFYPERTKALLVELCIYLGFCLPSEGQDRLIANPPADIDEFTDAVFREEGMDPMAERNVHVRKQVRERVARHLQEFRRNLEQPRESADGNEVL